jgi:hypothetical protein
MLFLDYHVFSTVVRQIAAQGFPTLPGKVVESSMETIGKKQEVGAVLGRVAEGATERPLFNGARVRGPLAARHDSCGNFRRIPHCPQSPKPLAGKPFRPIATGNRLLGGKKFRPRPLTRINKYG